MKFAVIVFPGTCGDTDTHYAIRDILGAEADYVRHNETGLEGFDAVILPGGFSYGDYLRCGAMAARTPVIPAVKKAALSGKPVLGIGNGFQILTEAGLLPGALMPNVSMRFICREAKIKVENNETIFTGLYGLGEQLRIPIAHGKGSYYADEQTLRALKETGRIVFTYADEEGGEAIAAIVNESGNVLGMMPHPERAVESLLGSEDGLRLFQSILQAGRARL